MEAIFGILESRIIKHATNMGIINHHWEQKKLNSLVDAVISAVIRSKITIKEFDDCLEKASNGKIINLDFFKHGGNVWKYIDSTTHPLAKALWSQRSTAIGTPNAASGEGELMFLFLSPEITMPTRGDLNVKGEEIELKGNLARVEGHITGNQLRIETVALAKQYGLKPNTPHRRPKEQAAELEKAAHESHWISQLAKMSPKDKQDFIFKWLRIVSPSATSKHATKLLASGFSTVAIQKVIVKLLYSDMVNRGNWSKIIFLGDGGSSIVCTDNISHFNSLIDSGRIAIGGDYFRIWQGFNIGWYIEPN